MLGFTAIKGFCRRAEILTGLTVFLWHAFIVWWFRNCSPSCYISGVPRSFECFLAVAFPQSNALVGIKKHLCDGHRYRENCCIGLEAQSISSEGEIVLVWVAQWSSVKSRCRAWCQHTFCCASRLAQREKHTLHAFCRSLPVQPVKSSQCRFIVLDVLLVRPWWLQIICYMNEKRCCLHSNYLIICTVCFPECKTYNYSITLARLVWSLLELLVQCRSLSFHHTYAVVCLLFKALDSWRREARGCTISFSSKWQAASIFVSLTTKVSVFACSPHFTSGPIGSFLFSLFFLEQETGSWDSAEIVTARHLVTKQAAWVCQ